MLNFGTPFGYFALMNSLSSLLGLVGIINDARRTLT
jgi:hypothetical protein